MAELEERVYTIPLVTKNIPRTKRASKAIKLIKQFVCRHMHTTQEQVWIDPGVNQLIWARGIQKPPHRIKAKVVKFEDGLVEVSLPEAEEEEVEEEEKKEKNEWERKKRGEEKTQKGKTERK